LTKLVGCYDPGHLIKDTNYARATSFKQSTTTVYAIFTVIYNNQELKIYNSEIQ